MKIPSDLNRAVPKLVAVSVVASMGASVVASMGVSVGVSVVASVGVSVGVVSDIMLLRNGERFNV